MIDDLSHLPPRDLGQWVDDVVAFLGLLAIALILLAFWGAYG